MTPCASVLVSRLVDLEYWNSDGELNGMTTEEGLNRVDVRMEERNLGQSHGEVDQIGQ